MKKGLLIYLLMFMLSTPLLVNAEEKQSSMVKMEEVVVTSGRIEEKKEDVTVSMTVITEEDIDKAMVDDLGDLLEDQGFQISGYGNSLNGVTIRGFKTDTHGNPLGGYSVLLVNGRSSGTGNVSEIPIENIEKVEIIRGPGAVQYGASAMGGVVNIITKKGSDKISGYVEGSLGSWNNQQAAAGISGAAHNFDFSLSGSHESQDDFDTAEGTTYLNTGFDAKDRFSVSAGYTFMPGNRFGVTYSRYDADHIGSPGKLENNDPDSYIDDSTRNLDLSYEGKTSNDQWLWSLKYFTTKIDYDIYDSPGVVNYLRQTDLKGLQAQLTFNMNYIRLTGGYDWNDYGLTNSDEAGKDTYDNPAFFLLAKSKLLNEKLVLSAGLRRDEFDITSKDGENTSDDNLSPSAGASYKITETLTVRANYAEAFKMPTPFQLFMPVTDWGPMFGIWKGNPDLQPESSKTWEIGANYSKSALSTELTYFSTDFENFIKTDYDSTSGYWTYLNVKGAELAGIEGSLRADIGEFFEWDWAIEPYASFTYFTKQRDLQNDAELDKPELTASYGIRVSNYELDLTSSLNFTHIDEEGDRESYTVADFSINKALVSWNNSQKMILKGGISNLLNRDYAVTAGYPAPGRTFKIGLVYVF